MSFSCTAHRRSGLHLIEVVMAMTVASVLLTAALQTVAVARINRDKTSDLATAHLLAEDLLSEIMRQDYADPEDVGKLNLAALPPSVPFGVDTGENGSTRADFDDVDDYNGWSKSPPQLKDGTRLNHLQGWARSVTVARINAGTFMNAASESGLKVVNVRVLHNGTQRAEVSALKGAGLPEGPPLLLVVADAGTLTTQETDKKALIESWGYRTTLISATAPQSEFDSAAGNNLVAYVVEQGQSTALGTKLRDTPIGVVNEEIELRADFGFSANRDWPTPRTDFDVIDNGHYITTPFSLGPLTICTAPAELVTLGGNKAPGLLVLGEIAHQGTQQKALSVIETGGELYGGGFAAGRRVQLPWGRIGFDINALNQDGQKLMKRAITWAASQDS